MFFLSYFVIFFPFATSFFVIMQHEMQHSFPDKILFLTITDTV